MTTIQRKAAVRLHDGSGLVASRLGRFLTPKDRPAATLIRCGAGLWLGTHVVPAMLDHRGLMVAGVGCWCWAAWRAKAAPAAAAGAAAEPTDTEITADTVDYLNRLIGDRKGVHLTDVLAGLVEQDLVPATTTVTELRRSLEARGIPVRDSVKVGGAVRIGVHRGDLPAPSETPPPATPKRGPVEVVVAGQIATTPENYPLPTASTTQPGSAA